ncbi:AbfB domain-containing protein [Amycolatopsis sp. NPDC051045]|uniref:AbfB domain-containing protein n=1 Tax=Amycolatopsis sp. NPDC051045 TaxID=3156922 RepID=UPI0034293E20
MTGRTRPALAAGAAALALLRTVAPVAAPPAAAAVTADAPRSATQEDKVRAAQEIGIVAGPDLLILTDRNFVFALWQRATGTEVRAAAERALRTMDEAQLKAYIGTGIHSANLQDWFTWIRKKGEADRRLLFELRTRAEQSRVHPALVAGANTAMAGTDDDVDRFLRLGQYEDAALVQSVRSQSPGASGWYLRGLTDAVVGAGTGADTAWRIVPGKADSTCHSFESVAHPEYYLRRQELRVVLAASDGTDRFRADATWCSKAGLSGTGVTLESFSTRSKFLRQYTTQVWAADSSGQHPYDTPNGYAAGASWQVDVP